MAIRNPLLPAANCPRPRVSERTRTAPFEPFEYQKKLNIACPMDIEFLKHPYDFRLRLVRYSPQLNLLVSHETLIAATHHQYLFPPVICDNDNQLSKSRSHLLLSRTLFHLRSFVTELIGRTCDATPKLSPLTIAPIYTHPFQNNRPDTKIFRKRTSPRT